MSKSELNPLPGTRLRRIAITMVCATAGVVAGLLILLAYSGRRPPPSMSATQFEEALSRWENHQPNDYVMDIKVFGRQSGEVQIEVRDKKPVRMIRNGIAAREHTWEHWTVDGLFEIIRHDLEGLDEPARAFGAPRTGDQPPAAGGQTQVVQQAEFDAELGYPRRYRRAVQNTGDDVEWEIVRFEKR